MTSTFTNWEVYAVRPAAGENLITNPSVEVATTGYAAVNSTLAVSSTYARYGAQSLRATPTDAGAAGAYWTCALTSGTTYTFSLSLKGEAGKTYTLAFVDDTGGAIEASTQFTANGHWQRRSVTFTADETDTFYLQVLRDVGQSSTAVFYTDGWQLETGSAMTTYIDGTLDVVIGTTRGRREYHWTGAVHASTSKRVGWTASGGTMTRLRDYCKILAITGLGMPQISAIATDITTGGALYQWSRAGNRDISIVASFSGTTPGDIANDIAAVQTALDCTSFYYRQPLRIVLQGWNAAGTIEQSETIYLDCAYTGGLEGGFNSYYSERRVISLRNYTPTLRGEGYTTADLGWQQALTGDLVVRVKPDGTIDNFGVTESTDTHKGYCMAKNATGVTYLGGEYQDISGVSGASFIAQASSLGVWSAMGTVSLTAPVQDMVVADNGTLYFCGNFTNAGGDAAADYIAKWDGSNFSAVGTAGASDVVTCLAISKAGHLYAGGQFHGAASIGGVDADYLARWNGSTYAAVGSATALNGNVFAVIPDPWGNGVIVSGQFTNAGGNSAIDYLSRVTITGTTYAHSLIGASAPNAAVYGLHYDETAGRLYAVGAFTSIGGVAANYVAYYDGAQWNAMGTGFGDAVSVGAKITSQNGKVHFTGNNVQTAGGLTLPDGFATWSGNRWTGQKFDATGAAFAARGVFYDNDTGDLSWLGIIESSTTEAKTTITNAGYEKAYPILSILGPGTVYGIQSYTTGERVDFNGLTLRAGEYATIVFGESGIVSAWGSSLPFHGKPNVTGRDLRPYIVSGSSATITLRPDANAIGLFIYGGTSAATAATISYPLVYRAIEASIF